MSGAMQSALGLVGVTLGGLLVVAVVSPWTFGDEAPPPPLPTDEGAPGDAGEATKEDRVRARLSLAGAEAALREGRLEESRAAAEEALALAPGLVEAVRLLAVVEKRAGRGHEACRLMRDYVGRAATPEPARARLLESACDDDAGP